MKKLTHSLLAKCIAFFLAVLLLLTAAGSAIGLYNMANTGFYTADEQAILASRQQNELNDALVQIMYAGVFGAGSDSSAESLYPAYSSNLRFTVTDDDTRKVIESTWPSDTALTQVQSRSFLLEDFVDDDSETLPCRSVTVKAGLVEGLSATDRFSIEARLIHLAYAMRFWAIAICALSALAGIACVVFLCCAAGHRGESDEIVLNPFDRIPLDLYLAGDIGIVALFFAFAQTLSTSAAGLHVIAGIACLCFIVLALALLLTAATRRKKGGALKNTVLWRILRLLGRGLRWVGSRLAYLLGGLPLIWKTLLGLTVFSIVELFCLMSTRYDGWDLFSFWFVEKLILLPLLLTLALNLRWLQAAGRRMAAGDLEHEVETRHLVGDFRRFGDDLNNIRSGMTRAVDERMKSERLKTELITNVSHDIKTPLTSIINYVDLIKKEKPESETLRQYVDVLDHQSIRLKKLIEDLIEASKASSGALAVHAEPCELGVLLGQAVGEYSEKLAAAGLTPVQTVPEKPVRISADGRHLWRIFDNLLSNICKYAQPGTRVYLEVGTAPGQAVVTFRNISRDELNITAEELTERFVRGDRSRHTEGSGLGLSIARSLAELQGGTLGLAIDGDLFKATLCFPLLS